MTRLKSSRVPAENKASLLVTKILDETEKLVEAPGDEEFPRLQKNLSRAHDRMRKPGQPGGPEDGKVALPEAEQFAAAVGHLNYQVENGGFDQWFFNGYASDEFSALLEYCKKYGGQYEGFRKLGAILAAIQEEFEAYDSSVEDFSRHDQLPWVPDRDAISQAISDEDYQRADELLGGSELFSRFERTRSEVVDDFFSMSIDGDDENGPFSVEVTFNPSGAGGDTIFEQGGFSSYEEAEEAAEQAIRDYEDEHQEEISNAVAEYLEAEVDEILSNTSNFDRLDRFDEEFYKFNKQLLADAENILAKEYGLVGRAKAMLAKAASAVGSKSKDLASKARKAVGGALNRAARKISGTTPEE